MILEADSRTVLNYHADVKNSKAILLCLGLAAGCAHAPDRTRERSQLSPADYFPLAVGNSWVYVDHSPQLQPGAPRREHAVRIVSRDAEGYYHDNAGGQLRTDPDCLHDRLRRLLCRPFESGKTWSSVVSVTSTERYEIVSSDARVETPAGIFNHCIKVRAHNRAGPDADQILEATYAPGVGMVRIETSVVMNDVVAPQVQMVLESYKLQGR